MRKHYLTKLLLCCLTMITQAAWADNVVVFSETFDKTTGTGGRDGKFSGSIATNNIKYDGTEWSGVTKCGGASQCLKFGTGSDNGTLTTPAITMANGTTAVLTFNAAAWDDNVKNKLTVTATGCDIAGDTDIELTPAEWNAYTVIITNATAGMTLTFTGKRGFLDDVVVENITSMDAPTLPEEGFYWPHTTEAASKTITLTPARLTTISYTTDGSVPSASNGTKITQTSDITVSGNATLKAMAFVGDVTSPVVSKTYTVGSTVNGIAAFKALADGTEARIYVADGDNARVLHGHNKEMYLRDNSGTLCLDFGTTATFNPTPAHNQHVAGWVVGQKQTVNGLTKLVATENTNTNYLAMATPITEAATEPTAITDVMTVNDHMGDWVTLSEARVGNEIAVNNSFNAANYTDAYYGALVDISGIVTANSTVSPVFYDNVWPVVYVIDDDKEFTSPNADIEHATVRLKRTLSKDYWNTLTLPFAVSSFAGEIRKYSDLSGNTMIFSDESNMEAGKPYLVKPWEDIVNPEYKDVTLSATAAQNIEYTVGDIAFVGTYSPTELATDKTMMFLKSDGKLYFPTNSGARLKGMRAYFKVPQGVEARLFLGDGDIATGIKSMQNAQGTMHNDVYDLQGRKVTGQSPMGNGQLKKGLYIVNGKKVVIK